MADLDIVRNIEKELNVTLLESDHIQYNRAYTLNEDGQVTALGLYHCEIRELSRIIAALQALPQLQTLYLSDNQITDYSFLKELPQLQTLYLSYNQITDYSFLKELTQLQTLDLSNNQITDYSFLKELTQLQTLDLRANQITDISFLKELTQLQTLDLSYNQITDISFLEGLGQLRALALIENPIEELAPWITDFNMKIQWGQFAEAGSITLYDNPLKSPPVEFVKQGKEAVRDYFKSLEGSRTVKLNEVKVLLVGEGMAGKTSLLKQLQGLEFDKDESQTHGINVVSLNVDELHRFGKVEGLADCRLHCWDFGGQEIMHASHQFFLSKRSLYILVLDSRTDSKKYHWLRHIEKFGGDSPVMVVMNKIDANPSYNIEQKRINDDFPQVKNRFYRISCKTGDGVSTFVESLPEAIAETSLFGTDISIDWMNIKDRVVEETNEHQYISREQYVEICNENNVTDESMQLTLLQFLHDLGIVLYFEQLNLANIYVLDAHWVTIGVYKIINSAKTQDGILRESDLDYILNKEEIKTDEYDPAAEKQIAYSREEQRYILDIMMQFELCYKYNERENHYIIPDLLPKELDEEPELKEGTPLHFVMGYDYLPSSIISRLMLRFKNDIVDRQQWRYGMILDNHQFGCRAKVKADEQHRTITITVQGDSRRKQQYFSVIRHNILDINSEFENLKIEEFIPLPGHPNIRVEYQELLGYEKAGRDEYFVGKLGKAFSVSEMLDSVISRDERSKEHNIMRDINVNLSNIGNPQQTVTQTQEADLTASQQQTVTQEVKTVQGLFKNLKEDILEEVEIEIEDEKEKKRITNELQKAENAFDELEQAATENRKELDVGTKGRLEEFIGNLADGNSRLNKALNLVSKGKEKAQNLARTYNKFAPFFALPSVPGILLGKEGDD